MVFQLFVSTNAFERFFNDVSSVLNSIVNQQRIILKDVSSEMHTFEKHIVFYRRKYNSKDLPEPALPPAQKRTTCFIEVLSHRPAKHTEFYRIK